MTHDNALRARSFDAAAAAYARHRPSYPPALFDAVEQLVGRSLDGAVVVDVGAGTGIATALLVARGARVLAVEPGDGMAAQFRSTLPGVPLVRGDGDALPLADGSADLITYAQSWHWTDQKRSVPEAMRVLRTGGALALWWNVSDHEVDWIAAQDARLRVHLGAEEGAHGGTHRPKALTEALDFTARQVAWTRTLSVEDHLANLATHSAFLVRDARSTADFMERERRELLEVFPDGQVEERYVVDLRVAYA
ncbi:class I SAM-dependent methyltransferase [Streptomyces sp. NPDC001941]|uniref:class I SAM-dependent methyltransferase n=1 Tax=Streptomyces sp. NPDC001941 TaxID=3154659 RepID=UPI00331A5F36